MDEIPDWLSIECVMGLDQGSQTQSDLRAAWDSKKGLEGRIASKN